MEVSTFFDIPNDKCDYPKISVAAAVSRRKSCLLILRIEGMEESRPTGLTVWSESAITEVLPETVRLQEKALERLEAAIFSDCRSARLQMIEAMQVAGIKDADIVDRYIPAMARRLGEQWCSDRRSFADVTIGTARLQSMVHDVAVDWLQDLGPRDNSALSVLLIVRKDIYHTLGAIVAATQFRRSGAFVRIALGKSDEDLISETRYGAYDMIAISASPSEELASLQCFIVKLREKGRKTPFVALGGTMLEATESISTLTGADYVGNDPVEALKQCEKRSSRGTSPKRRLSAKTALPMGTVQS
jgi:methanogenic corrinoid protein MtbC1